MQLNETNNGLTVSIKTDLKSLWIAYRIFISDNYFEIQKTFLGVKLSVINISYDSYIYYKKDTYFYLKNSTNTVRVIFEDDLDGAYLKVMDDQTNKIINISSAELTENLFRQLTTKLPER